MAGTSPGRATKHSSGRKVQPARGTISRRRLEGLSEAPAVSMPATEPAAAAASSRPTAAELPPSWPHRAWPAPPGRP
jgi:hypothetical protein